MKELKRDGLLKVKGGWSLDGKGSDVVSEDSGTCVIEWFEEG